MLRRGGHFPHTTEQLSTPAGCPTSQLNSNTIYLEIVSDPTGLQGSALLPTYFRHQSRVQVVICVSDQLAIVWSSNNPLLGFDLFAKRITKFGEKFYLLYYISSLQKDVTQVQPYGRGAQGKVCGKKHWDSKPSPGGSFPTTSLCSSNQKLSKPCLSGIWWRFPWTGMTD